MRTTLTLDDDLAARLKEIAHRQRSTFKEVVNAVLRLGLSSQARSDAAAEPYQVRTFRSGLRAGVDPLKLNQLSDEIESRHHRERLTDEDER